MFFSAPKITPACLDTQDDSLWAAPAAASRAPRDYGIPISRIAVFLFVKVRYMATPPVPLKLRAADLKRPTKKSELMRAGIAMLNKLAEK